MAICLRYAASRLPFGLALTAFASSHNLPLRTSCMSQIMPHPRPLGVSCPSQFQYKTKKTSLRRLLCFRAGGGIDVFARNLAFARLARHPYGLFACAQSPKFFPRASPTKEFSVGDLSPLCGISPTLRACTSCVRVKP